MKVVQQKFGGHVRQEVIGDVIESSYQEALIAGTGSSGGHAEYRFD